MLEKGLTILGLETGILKNICLQVKAGECVGIVGESGSGKTTILNAIAGYTPYQGLITLGDKDLNRLAPWQRNCRYLNQHLYLFPHKTIAGNLTLAHPISAREEQKVLLEKLKIAHLIDRFPHQLSGGEKQRAALARALINPPDLLLLDEPFSALDWDTRRHIWKALKTLITEKNLTTIIVSHEPKETDYFANRIIGIDKGRLMQKQEMK